jgi:thymidylate synthase
MNFGDTHIYKDHCKGAIRQILREPYKFPTLKISTKRNFNEYIFEDFELCNYESYPAINFKMVA